MDDIYDMNNHENYLFPKDIPERQWLQFEVSGFDEPACGMIFTASKPVCCGVALGGIGTGSLDIQSTGVLGFSTVFPAPQRNYGGVLPFYRNPQLLLPFLGLSVGSRTWVLARQEYLDGGVIHGCMEPNHPDQRVLEADPVWRALWSSDVAPSKDVMPAREIRYFGHFPVADLEYDIDSPVGISLRAWAPFIPGDYADSNIPGAVFEVSLHNGSRIPQEGCVAFSFPGPVHTKPQYDEFIRSRSGSGKFTGVQISSPDSKISYALGVTGEKSARFGGSLTGSSDAWSKIRTGLPDARGADAGSSLAVDFKLAPSESKTIRIILSWHAPVWQGGKYNDIRGFDGPEPLDPYDPDIRRSEGKIYTAMYATRFKNALESAEKLATGHESLLRRVLAWQEAIYSSDELPVWLRDCLVNNLNLMVKDSSWAGPDAEIGEWTKEFGVFGMNESPRSCSIIGCIASNFYGDHPIAYFYPELEKSQMRAYHDTMRPDGAVPFLFPTGDWTRPAYKAMVGINGACYVDLVDRLWMVSGDDSVLLEFYDSVKKTTILAMTMVPGDEGVMSLPFDGLGQEWWEYTALYGLVTHFGGVRLAHLRMAERMAEKTGDVEFAVKCREWFAHGSRLLEEKLWNGDNYLLYFDPKTGNKDETIMSSQLDGDWIAFYHGLPPVFPDGRALETLATIKATCLTDLGAAGFASREKGLDVGVYGTFTPEIHMVGMTYSYRGEPALGLDLSRRVMDDVIRVQGHPWDLPNMIRIDDGKRFYGTDYYQNMMLWALPAAIAGNDITGPCKSGGLVDRVIKAGISPFQD